MYVLLLQWHAMQNRKESCRKDNKRNRTDKKETK